MSTGISAHLPITAFTLAPSLQPSSRVALHVAAAVPASARALGLPVSSTGAVPVELGVDRAQLAALGFSGEVGSTWVAPNVGGPCRVAVGVGDPRELDAAGLRNAAAAFARGAATNGAVATSLGEAAALPPDVAAQAVVEGVLLARYRYDALKRTPSGTPVTELTLVTGPERSAKVQTGAERGRVFAAATTLARDLANTPHNHLTATDFAEVALRVGKEKGFAVEVFDKAALKELGCGGLLGVNAGSSQEPRMVKLTYQPKGQATGRLALVGKGIMYDAGGLGLKPNNEVHAQMKNDMSGAAAILAAVASLGELGCTVRVTGYLMCTDNVPSGTAMALGDVIRIRGGTTVEVINTDAEGRLVMADGLVLAREQGNDAIVDIATLTGACLRALGPELSGLMGNDPRLVQQVEAAAERVDEPVWELPLARRYRKRLDSGVADLANVAIGAAPDALIAGLFLSEFVDGVPWAHLDICGTAQNGEDRTWLPAGCTGTGARLLTQLALDFRAPSGQA